MQLELGKNRADLTFLSPDSLQILQNLVTLHLKYIFLFSKLNLFKVFFLKTNFLRSMTNKSL